MAEPLKYVYNEQFFDLFTKSFSMVKSDFNSDAFLKDIHSDGWEEKELKERMRHISVTMKKHLTDDFTENVATILKLIEQLLANDANKDSFEYMFLPDFIELYGLDNYQLSIFAFENITQFVSCEFGVRPFLKKYPERMYAQMLAWSKHQHPMVRRLSSEGFRPRLPWGMGIPILKKEPAPILPILEILKNDESESVRRSVANNLNDISKDHPDLVIDLMKQWQGKTPETDWVVKHACRTLLKQGNLEAMQLFGFGAIDKIEVMDLEVLTPEVKIGEALSFHFHLKNKISKAVKIRLEYGIYYLKGNGSLSRKVFKISEKEYAGNSVSLIEKRQSFKVITTRKFYVGAHQISVIVNGVEMGKVGFELIDA